MIRNAKAVEGCPLKARDGEIGKVKDFYFDDEKWTVRYFVVEAGDWLHSHKVLIAPEAVGGPEWEHDWEAHALPVNLSRDQVRKSPVIDTEKPVSRQHELELRQYYGWPYYWTPVPIAGGVPVAFPPPPPLQTPEGDQHLHSVRAVTGYTIAALDGTIGHVEDFLIETDAWDIRYLVVDTRNWLPGRKVILAPAWIRKVSWRQSSVFVDLQQDAIRRSPEYDPSRPFDSDYAHMLHEFYGRPQYTTWGHHSAPR